MNENIIFRRTVVGFIYINFVILLSKKAGQAIIAPLNYVLRTPRYGYPRSARDGVFLDIILLRKIYFIIPFIQFNYFQGA
ncbi:MAG: hypothetical protein ACI965_002109 [Paraglaciecola sp.]|jgi:hypothetical protein